MKATVVLLAAAASYSAAQPHNHVRHDHLHHKRQDPDTTTNVVIVPTTHVVYVLDGEPISGHDVREGIKNGSLVWANGGRHHHPAPVSVPSETVAITSSDAQSTTSSVSTSSASSSPQAVTPSSNSLSGGQGVDTPFPSGELDCSTFPSDYGAIAVDWIGLGGWTGIQSPGSDNGGYDNIMTLTASLCASGDCCTEGRFCSYACPAGYQKSQWPTEQGATGQSVGGIQCSGGKLHLTNPSMSSSLCMRGSTEVDVQVQNKMGSGVAVCRTDYPGTESETIPLNAGAGTTNPLTMPDANDYYNWEGSHTSAQYYVNPAGISVEDACQWGTSDNPWGNFAPLNLGVGYSNGAAWLSIFQNLPTTSATLDFSVEIVGEGMSGTCRYSNGQYCGGADYDSCSSTTGCTVGSDLFTPRIS